MGVRPGSARDWWGARGMCRCARSSTHGEACARPAHARWCLPCAAPATAACRAVKVAKRELQAECDYAFELQSQQRFKALIGGDADTARVRRGMRCSCLHTHLRLAARGLHALPGGPLQTCPLQPPLARPPPSPPPPPRQFFHVPDVIPELSTRQVLTSEWVPGVHIDKVGAAGGVAGGWGGGDGGANTRSSPGARCCPVSICVATGHGLPVCCCRPALLLTGPADPACVLPRRHAPGGGAEPGGAGRGGHQAAAPHTQGALQLALHADRSQL